MTNLLVDLIKQLITNFILNLMENNKREKLYEQMEKYPYSLPEFDEKKLLLFMDTRECNGILTFKYYSEFLNIFNSIVLFYVYGFNLALWSS